MFIASLYTINLSETFKVCLNSLKELTKNEKRLGEKLDRRLEVRLRWLIVRTDPLFRNIQQVKVRKRIYILNKWYSKSFLDTDSRVGNGVLRNILPIVHLDAGK